jgi:hypothetical protein
MKVSWFAIPFFSFGILVFSANELWASSDKKWQWAANGFGVTVFIQTTDNCTESDNSKVLLMVINNQDYELEADFRVTNAYWSKQMTVDLKPNATDSHHSRRANLPPFGGAIGGKTQGSKPR